MKKTKVPLMALLQALLLLLAVLLLALQCHLSWRVSLYPSHLNNSNNLPDSLLFDANNATKPTCALLFFGLPRAFTSLVLPSIRQNILLHNPNCHVYVHFYQQTQEAAGRSGQGGTLRPDEIYQLQKYVTVSYIQAEPETQFWPLYETLLQRVNHTKHPQTNRPLYFPWKAKTYNYQTMVNIFKMWHSIQSVWKLMEHTSQQQGYVYDEVALLRSDVVYLTPLRLNEYANEQRIVIPGFGKYPISDRMVYGPYDAVRIWATERFPRIEEHVQFIAKHDPGWGLHEERFLNYTIFPAIRQVLHNEDAIFEHPQLCFLRARADESVWISDCTAGGPNGSLRSIAASVGNVTQRLEAILGRHCHGPPKRLTRSFLSVDCAKQ
ncbi:hypothetical protein FisN_8Hh372 [Fistulifera solaris]|uniref:Uncharacterized protein n=1 Tax=Fistulifera solaris TaxID=1519565 RepID=A0A1Z5K837_FISSO|nr:hypothetical protein FisN_8Hh372 [Fistulifera solaris]|eukprot:GAX22384.1 hypothetical protein FisN_8Hh372 [Fistulifera solaris]